MTLTASAPARVFSDPNRDGWSRRLPRIYGSMTPLRRSGSVDSAQPTGRRRESGRSFSDGECLAATLPRVRAARWLSVVVVSAVTLLAVAFAFIDTLWVMSQRDCPLGMEFERSRSEVLEHRSVPPKVGCRYHFANGVNGQPLYPPETVTYDTFTAWVVASVLLVVATLLWWLALRAETSLNREPAASGSPP